jgi:hypothetical protein
MTRVPNNSFPYYVPRSKFNTTPKRELSLSPPPPTTAILLTAFGRPKKPVPLITQFEWKFRCVRTGGGSRRSRMEHVPRAVIEALTLKSAIKTKRSWACGFGRGPMVQ